MNTNTFQMTPQDVVGRIPTTTTVDRLRGRMLVSPMWPDEPLRAFVRRREREVGGAALGYLGLLSRVLVHGPTILAEVSGSFPAIEILHFRASERRRPAFDRAQF